MAPAFETGAPRTGTELSHALGALLAAGTAYVATLTDERFFEPQGEAWSPADHLRHLELSLTPLTLGLRLPRWLLTLRFGRRPGGSRGFEQVRDAYLATLRAGGQAGRYAPARESMPTDPAARRREILTAWARATVDLQVAVGRWPEEALDRQLLPHPLLGSLTVREMLAFTVYHTAHHLRRVAERASA
jgi:hypothetical protein